MMKTKFEVGVEGDAALMRNYKCSLACLIEVATVAGISTSSGYITW